MRRRQFVMLVGALAAVAGPPCAQAMDDAEAVKLAIIGNYATYSGFDEQKYRATTTEDFVLLEHGELIDREGDVTNMAKPGTGFRRTDEFDFHSVTIEGDIAYAVYLLRSEIFDDAKGARSREWLESAILRRSDPAWKMALLHSTRVSHPSASRDMKAFAIRYTAAWCSQDPASVAAFFAPGGSLKINQTAPNVGRTAIIEAARSFMSVFPDMVVEMNALDRADDRFVYRWTLTGTNTGPGGSNRKVRISGYEDWKIGADGLIAESLGHFDETDYNRQLGLEAQAN